MLAIVCAGVVLASLDLFIVNVALPQIGRDFNLHGSGLADLSWVLNGYAIVYAAFLVLFGRMAERYRRERGVPARRGGVRGGVGGVWRRDQPARC